MKRIILFCLTLSVGILLYAEETKKPMWTDFLHPYGIVRTYAAFDTRESLAALDELFYYMPKDVQLEDGKDVNALPAVRMAALSTRLGLDVRNVSLGKDYSLGAKIEFDFCAGLVGNTGTAQVRLRQAYLTIGNPRHQWLVGQAWHPMAADVAPIMSLEVGCPFTSISRSPMIKADVVLNRDPKEVEHGLWSMTAALLWQMQYTSTGPEGASANYIRYACAPEAFLGLNFKGAHTLAKLGGNVLSIKPRARYDERLTTINAFAYAKEQTGNWTFAQKLTWLHDGSHMNNVGGYGVSAEVADGSRRYTPTQTLMAWASFGYSAPQRNHQQEVKGYWQPTLFLGYLNGFGTKEEVIGDFYCKNNADKLRQMLRVQPELIYHMPLAFGALDFGLEYMMTMVEYGNHDEHMRVTSSLHWVTNHRVQAMVKYAF